MDGENRAEGQPRATSSPASVIPPARTARRDADFDHRMPALSSPVLDSDEDAGLESPPPLERLHRGSTHTDAPSAEGSSSSASSSGITADQAPQTSPRFARGTRQRAISNASNDSLPSLQTVSDSSDGEWEDDEDDEEADDDEDDENDSGHEDNDGEPSGPNLRPLPYSVPEAAQRLMDTLQHAIVDPPWTNMPSMLNAMNDDEVDLFGSQDIWGGTDSARTRRPQSQNPLFRTLNSPRTIVDALRQMLESMGTPAVPEQDPVRAETIMKALEVVPEDLVRRYEKLRAGLEDEDHEGCAVCRESFLDPTAEARTVTVQFADLPSPPPAEDCSSNPAKILAFPCPGMHLFHSQCLSPWLGRKTTCPTCRFDIDPDSLTLSFLRELRTRSRDPLASKPWAPPKNKGFRRWLEREERKLDPEYVAQGKLRVFVGSLMKLPDG